MGEQRQLRCLIAAGGTVGHVAPSLAVAEALRARGVEVTFAGSPDRVEARLVPERGYAFDAFRVAGFPRRPGPQLLRAFALAAAAPLACLRILARRKPDVVLGGGGYVGGPMLFAAWLRRIPAALTEADAHLGLANRLAAPFVQRLFLAYPADANGKVRVVGRPIPSPHATSNHRATDAEYFEHAGGARVVQDEQAHAVVPELVAELLANPELRQRMSDAMRAAAKPDAADSIADELVALAAARR